MQFLFFLHNTHAQWQAFFVTQYSMNHSFWQAYFINARFKNLEGLTSTFGSVIFRFAGQQSIKIKEIAVIKTMNSEQEKLAKRMDRFDSVVHEYLRSTRKSVEYLSEKIGCDPSSLWRYRNRTESFEKMPLETFCGCMRVANISNENLRYILGLPTGTKNDN